MNSISFVIIKHSSVFIRHLHIKGKVPNYSNGDSQNPYAELITD